MKLSIEERRLMRRYLIWCFKTTKEALDRVDRYFTQHMVDQFVLGILEKEQGRDADCNKKVSEFEDYLEKKYARAVSLKYTGPHNKDPQPEYWYLQTRLKAIREAITHFLGAREMEEIQSLYEQEMTRRILEAREHA